MEYQEKCSPQLPRHAIAALMAGERSRLVSYKLTWLDRGLCVVVGLLLAAPMEVAVFMGHGGNAPLGFGIIGGITLIIGAIGRLPAKAAWRDVSLEYWESEQEATDILANRLTLRDLEGAGQVVRRISDGRDVTNTESRILQHATFARQVKQELQAAATSVGADCTFEPSSDGATWDAKLSRDGRVLIVEVRLRIDELVANDISALLEKIPGDASLMLVADEITPEALPRIMKFKESVAILVRSNGINLASELKSSVKEILTDL